jgi:hypothetical protein
VRDLPRSALFTISLKVKSLAFHACSSHAATSSSANTRLQRCKQSQQPSVGHGEVAADTGARADVADHDSTETNGGLFTDPEVLRHNRAGSDPGIGADSNVAVDHRTVADENTPAQLHAVRHKGIRPDADIVGDQGILAKQAGRNHCSGQYACTALHQKSSGMIHLDHRLGGSDRLEANPAENSSRADHRILADYAAFQNRGVRRDFACRANPDIAFGNPGSGMHFGGRIDDGWKIVPVEAAKRQFIMKVREDGPGLVTDRYGHAARNSVGQFGSCQNSAHRTISLKPSEKSAALQEYELVRIGIGKEPERLEVSIAMDCHWGRKFHFA